MGLGKDDFLERYMNEPLNVVAGNREPPKVVDVKPETDYHVHVKFENGEEGLFDVGRYVFDNYFKPLKDKTLFDSVRPVNGTIQWDGGIEIGLYSVYLGCKTSVPRYGRDGRRFLLAEHHAMCCEMLRRWPPPDNLFQRKEKNDKGLG